MENPKGKRRATTELNHDNWDCEDEKETDTGTFQVAPEDVLKKRVIKKARRKLDDTNPNSNGELKNAFQFFTGFGKPADSTASSAAPVSATITKPSITSGIQSETPSSSHVFSFLKKFATGEAEEKSSNNIPASTEQTKTPVKSSAYYAKLKLLNQDVTKWIKMHVDKEPLCLLSPIFRDYEKYLKEIEESEKPSVSAGNKPSTPMFAFKPATSTTSPAATTSFSFMNNNPAPPTTPAITFGSKNSESPKTNAPSSTFSLGNLSSTTSNSTVSTISGISFNSQGSITNLASGPSGGFRFGGDKPFSFANVAPPPANAVDLKDKDEEDDQPPKVEFKAVIEEDSVYSKRCKVFFKNGDSYTDRGVGTLFLKPVKDSDKIQLLVRADTNLGNILVNLILNESIPTQKMGKNNVMLVCIPNPDFKKSTPILLRVKNSDEADELLAEINRRKV